MSRDLRLVIADMNAYMESLQKILQPFIGEKDPVRFDVPRSDAEVFELFKSLLEVIHQYTGEAIVTLNARERHD